MNECDKERGMVSTIAVKETWFGVGVSARTSLEDRRALRQGITVGSYAFTKGNSCHHRPKQKHIFPFRDDVCTMLAKPGFTLGIADQLHPSLP